MRLDPRQKAALRAAIKGVSGEVFLFGSRVDDALRGGDIDLLILTHEEPYDALSDRPNRTVEGGIRFMRSPERRELAESSETLRDLLHRMERRDLVSDAGVGWEMRDIRNRMVHDYLPQQRAAMFADILGPFGAELCRFRDRARARRL